MSEPHSMSEPDNMSRNDREPKGDQEPVAGRSGSASERVPVNIGRRRDLLKSIVASVPVVLTVAAGTAHAQDYTYNQYPDDPPVL